MMVAIMNRVWKQSIGQARFKKSSRGEMNSLYTSEGSGVAVSRALLRMSCLENLSARHEWISIIVPEVSTIYGFVRIWLLVHLIASIFDSPITYGAKVSRNAIPVIILDYQKSLWILLSKVFKRKIYEANRRSLLNLNFEAIGCDQEHTIR